jgi:exopolysaccharide production protein ExoQ
VLIVLTEDDPLSAFRHMMKRCAFALLPLSVLLIKYFPQFGRTFSEFTGVAQNSGVALNKNGLGCICMIFGLFFVWQLATVWRNYAMPLRRREIGMSLAFLGIIAWLFVLAPSSTALLCFLVASAVVLYLGRANVTPSRLGAYTVVVVLTLGAAEMLFGISNLVLVLTGKSATLTGRTDLWHDILQIKVNRLVGAGYESFWLGGRLQSLWDIYWWRPNQAHNGYLETYLNLGIIGVAFLTGLIFVAFRKCSQAVVEQPEFGRFRFGFLFLTLLYNWPEAAFRGLHVVLFIFYLIAMDSPFRSARRVTAEEYDWEEPRGEPTLGYA